MNYGDVVKLLNSRLYVNCIVAGEASLGYKYVGIFIRMCCKLLRKHIIAWLWNACINCPVQILRD